MCRRGLQCRYQVRCPCLGKPSSSLLKVAHKSLWVTPNLLWLVLPVCGVSAQEDEQSVKMPWAMPRVYGVWWWRDLSLQSSPVRISLPGGFKQTMGWLYCSVYPREHWIQVFPSVFAPAGCSGEECAPLGCLCCRVIPERQTDRMLKIKLKEDCKWQKSWRQDFQRAQFVRKTAAFYSMLGMADGRDIWHFALIEWQVERRQQRYCKQITWELELGRGRIWGKLCGFGWTPWLIHCA